MSTDDTKWKLNTIMFVDDNAVLVVLAENEKNWKKLVMSLILFIREER